MTLRMNMERRKTQCNCTSCSRSPFRISPSNPRLSGWAVGTIQKRCNVARLSRPCWRTLGLASGVSIWLDWHHWTGVSFASRLLAQVQQVSLVTSRAWIPACFIFGTFRFLEARFCLFVYPKVSTLTRASCPLSLPCIDCFSALTLLLTRPLFKRDSRLLFNPRCLPQISVDHICVQRNTPYSKGISRQSKHARSAAVHRNQALLQGGDEDCARHSESPEGVWLHCRREWRDQVGNEPIHCNSQVVQCKSRFQAIRFSFPLSFSQVRVQFFSVMQLQTNVFLFARFRSNVMCVRVCVCMCMCVCACVCLCECVCRWGKQPYYRPAKGQLINPLIN